MAGAQALAQDVGAGTESQEVEAVVELDELEIGVLLDESLGVVVRPLGLKPDGISLSGFHDGSAPDEVIVVSSVPGIS